MQVADMTTEALQAEAQRCCYDIAEIKLQLELARSDAAKGVYADYVWYRNATCAKRKKGVRHQEILQELKKRKLAERRASQVSFERFFMDEVRAFLPPEQFYEIFQNAERKRDSCMPL